MRIGQRVHYILEYYNDEYRKVNLHGIVKAINEEKDIIFVVFDCENCWDEYKNYTANSIKKHNLNYDWVYEIGEKIHCIYNGYVINGYIDSILENGFYKVILNYGDDEFITKMDYKANIYPGFREKPIKKKSSIDICIEDLSNLLSDYEC